MTTIIEATIPVGDFALAETFQTCSDATVECEELVTPPDETAMPLLWVRNTSPDVFEAALDQDSTVETYTQLTGTETRWLYEIHWTADTQLVLQLFTGTSAMILEMKGSVTGWDLRALFPNRDDVRTIHEFCETHNLTVDMHTIRELTDESEATHSGSLRTELTSEQYEALTAAYRQGYFEVPRALDLEDLSEEMDISHQALSERLRRAHQTLIGDGLLVGAGPTAADQQSTASDEGRVDEGAQSVDD
jgi:predicted DNA binding protein